MLWSNDSDGVPLSNAEHGLPPLFKAKGYEVVDAGFHQPLSDDFSAQIAVLKAAGVDIVTGVFLPPDFTRHSGANAPSRASGPKLSRWPRRCCFQLRLRR